MDVQGFFEANIITTLTYAEDASSGNTTIPMFVVQDVAGAIRFAPADAGRELTCVGKISSCGHKAAHCRRLGALECTQGT